MLERPLIYLVPPAAAALYGAVCFDLSPGLHASLLLLSLLLIAAGALIRHNRLFTITCMLAVTALAFSVFSLYRCV